VSNSQFADFNLDPALAEAVAAASEQEVIEGIIRLEDPKEIPPQFRLVSQFIRICTGRFRAADTWRIRRHPNVVSLKAARPLSIAQQSDSLFPVDKFGRPGAASLPYTGRGSIVAMLDFGLDFGHPNFLNPDATTRVMSLWHQGAPYESGSPNRYGYGRVFSQQEINLALLESDPYRALGYFPWISDTGRGSHGTHTTDIAAGNGRAHGSKRGVAPDADLLFVHLSTPRSKPGVNLGDSVRMLEALDFVHRNAGSRPCAINLSVGRTAGSHDGTSPFEQGMHELLDLAPGRAIAQSAGNYRSAHLAVHGRLRDGEQRELPWVIDPGDTKPTEIDAWYSGNDRFLVRVLSPSGLWVEARLGQVVDLKTDDGELIGRLYHRKNDPNNHDNHIDVFLYPNAPAGTWRLRLAGEYVINGRFHAWIERETSRSGIQARFDTAIASQSYTLGTIATSPLVLTVGALDAYAEGAPLASFSSCGPTRDERRDKPELLAPGVRILAARSIPKGAAQQEGLLVEMSGTSMAAPHLTGTIAVMFEAAARPLSIDEIRQCLERSADIPKEGRNTDCGGWGRLNIAAAIAAARDLRSLAHTHASSVIESDRTAAEAFLDRAECAVRSSYGGRQGSETSFLQRLLQEMGMRGISDCSPAALYQSASIKGSYTDQDDIPLDVIAVATQPLDQCLRAGDWMIRRVPGTGDIGHVSILAASDLLDADALTAAGILSEGAQSGRYGLVIESGTFPHTRSRPYARRFLDRRGRVPPHTILLRPRFGNAVDVASAPAEDPYSREKAFEDLPAGEAGFAAAPSDGDSDSNSDGKSADSALTFDDDPSDRDSGASGDPDDERLAVAWLRSDALLKLLRARRDPDGDERLMLKASLVRQLPTLWLYWQIEAFQAALEERTTSKKSISLFIILFPGEARDNTGVKDLNDNVFGQWWNGIFQQQRYDAIATIFDDGSFAVAAQTYKTAFITTYTKSRKDFVNKLVELDEALRVALLDTLQRAYDDDQTSDSQKKSIQALQKKLAKKGYRFDFFFGVKTLTPKGSSSLANVYLLVTEALKGAAIARFAAKSQTLSTRPIKKVAALPGVTLDSQVLDPRGKEYEWKDYLRCSSLAEKIKEMVLKGQVPDVTVEMNSVYVDTVWTYAFIEYKNLFWGNSDVIRDVRKRKLERAPFLSGGNVTYSFNLQKDILELWLVVLNMLDFVKSFESQEFNGTLKTHHDLGLESFKQLGHSKTSIDWNKLQYVLTHDSRLGDPIAVLGAAGEYQFYTSAADHTQRIFFSMDIRDLGVALMLLYEYSNREVNFRRYSDFDLMNETFRATDPIDVRRRATYDTIYAVFKKHYDALTKDATGARSAVEQVFRVNVSEPLGDFRSAVQIMLGGDEIYVAAHPLFARDLSAIVGEIDPLDLRCSVAFSSAQTVAGGQREANQKSHQRAMRHADLAPEILKRLERTNRRIERLIDMIEGNPKKAPRGAGYREELSRLPLRKVYARWKIGWPPSSMHRDARAKAYEALRSGEASAADDAVELVDFSGVVVNRQTLEDQAKTLEDKVRRDVGRDNVQIHAPPIVKIPKWVEKLLDWLLKDPGDKKRKP
jgi:subtilisin family serine protease